MPQFYLSNRAFKCLNASMLTTAVFEFVQLFYHATEIDNVANAVSEGRSMILKGRS